MLVFAAPAVAHHSVSDTEIFLDHAVEGDFLDVNGYIETERQGCLAGRTMKILYLDDDARTLVDRGSTSQHGAWALRAPVPSPNPDFSVVNATRKKSGGPGHVCASDRIINPFF